MRESFVEQAVLVPTDRLAVAGTSGGGFVPARNGRCYDHHMAGCYIDDSLAGRHAEALTDAATRFCNSHPGESWYISGIVSQRGLSLMANDGKLARTRVLQPAPNMADSIFEALEAIRNSR